MNLACNFNLEMIHSLWLHTQTACLLAVAEVFPRNEFSIVLCCSPIIFSIAIGSVICPGSRIRIWKYVVCNGKPTIAHTVPQCGLTRAFYSFSSSLSLSLSCDMYVEHFKSFE